jgi:hypothetical protein
MIPIGVLYLTRLSPVLNLVVVGVAFVAFASLMATYTELKLGNQVVAQSAYTALLVVFLAQFQNMPDVHSNQG